MMEERADSPFVSNVDAMKHFLSVSDKMNVPTLPLTAGVEHAARLKQETIDRLEDENQALRDENNRLTLELGIVQQRLNELQLVYKKKDKDKTIKNVAGRLFSWKK